jgi:hypothetical protein
MKTWSSGKSRKVGPLGGSTEAAGCEGAHPRLSGRLRPALRRERGRLLVAHVHDVDALLAAPVVDRKEMPAREREQLRDPVRLQALRHEPPAVQRGRLLGLRLGAHERSVRLTDRL